MSMTAIEALEAVPATTDAPYAGPGLLFDHLGVIVPNLLAGREFLAAALGVKRWTPVVEDSGLQVSVQFGSSASDGLVYELIAPFGEQSPIANALRSGKHILNHLAYRTADLGQAGKHLREQGCYPANEPRPAVAYGGHRVQFFVSPLRFVIELIEKSEHVHAFLQDRQNMEAARE